jgi:methionyl-tRNA synthetase
VHIVGKDILKFHALIWPALLLGAGLPPPRKIVAHGHWTVEHIKMSKSLGNVVAPRSLLASEGGSLRSDAVRYFLLRESRLELDSDFNAQLVQQRCVKECSDTLGNLASRILNKLFMPHGAATLIPGLRLTLPWTRLRNAGLVLDNGVDNTLAESIIEPQLLPLSDAQIALLVQAAGLRDAAEQGYETLEPGPALEAIMVVLQEANRVYSDSAPWKVRPSEADIAQWAVVVASGSLVNNFKLRDSDLQLVSIVYTILEVLRVSSILLQPAMPTTALQLFEALGLTQGLETDALTPTRKSLTSWASAVPCIAQPHHFSPNVKSSLILFPKPAFEGAGKENSGGAAMSKKAARKAVSKGGRFSDTIAH